jgi:hypothetical protein
MKRNFNEKPTHNSISIDSKLLCSPEPASKNANPYSIKHAN